MFKKKLKPRNIAEIWDAFKCTVTDTMAYTAHTTLLILKKVPASKLSTGFSICSISSPSSPPPHHCVEEGDPA